MQRLFFPILAAGLLAASAASGEPLSLAPPGQAMPSTPPMVVAAARPEMRGNLGGGFIEFLFGNSARSQQSPPPTIYRGDTQGGQPLYANTRPAEQQREDQMDPRFLRQEVEYQGKEAPGTVVIDTPNHFLYVVEANGKAMRYGIGVGRPGFTWSGVHAVSAKKEWPDWTPPDEMIKRQPYLPHFVAGGPNNPLGARAMYLGSTLYRIHGSNEPWTIGQNVSSGCIRMRNTDVIDLYERVKIGTKVVVL